MSSALCLNKLLENTGCDIALINEHKLLSHNSSFLNSLNSNYLSHTHCEMTDPFSFSYCGRGGVSILYRKSLTYNVETLNVGNERIVGIKVVGLGPKPYFIFSVYMPASNNINDYRDQIMSLQEIYSYYSDVGHVIFGGDMNASLLGEQQSNKYKSIELLKLINNNSLVAINNLSSCTGPSYTFLPTRTMIDYVFTDDITACRVQTCEILAEGLFSSTSDHLPIVCCLDTQQYAIYQPLDSITWTAWHKADPAQLQQYEMTLSASLQGLIGFDIHSQSDVDWFVSELCFCLLNAAPTTLPCTTFSEYTKPYWNTELKELHKLERQARVAWIIADRPRGWENPLYSEYKCAKDRFRSAQRRASEEYLDSSIQEMENAAECDLRLFWQLVKRKKSKQPNSCIEIIENDKVLTSPDMVLGAFVNFYKDLYSTQSKDHFDEN
ncbi:MAG: endonuclease/exonuclease/phosphatase family protein, partial [Candidatus Thiodiazotropha sp.]